MVPIPHAFTCDSSCRMLRGEGRRTPRDAGFRDELPQEHVACFDRHSQTGYAGDFPGVGSLRNGKPDKHVGLSTERKAKSLFNDLAFDGRAGGI